MFKILVAEDDKFLGNAYRVKLAKAGYEVVLAADGNEAIEALKVSQPDVILLDLMMPIKDGFSVLTDIGSNPTWKKIPVIIASNLGQREDIDKGLKLGAIDYIVKSDMSLEDILAKIKQHLPSSAAVPKAA
ncbi:MAG TPA: response regulator transcription factor [Vitreimonas sp.]|nr:response regulator transcription factor [Vitreimonas sp.]